VEKNGKLIDKPFKGFKPLKGCCTINLNLGYIEIAFIIQKK